MALPTLTIQDRTKRVKDAKTEAQKEIEEYRKKKEQEYKKFESEVFHHSSHRSSPPIL
jgi:V-type H+-transporting ATPase subunit G